MPADVSKVESPKKEFDPKAELVGVATKLVADFAAVPESIADQVDENGPLSRALVQASQVMERFTDPSNVNCQIGVRRVRERSTVVLQPGNDPGIHVVMVNTEGEMAQMDIYGGIRTPSPTDLGDSRTQSLLGRSHSQRTIDIIDNPTLVRITTYDAAQNISLHVWMEISSPSISPDDQYIRLKEMYYNDPEAGLRMNETHTFPQPSTEYALGRIRPLIKKLQDIRGVAWL